MKLKANKHQPPIGSLVVAKLLGNKLTLNVEWSDKPTELDANIGILLNTDGNIARLDGPFFISLKSSDQFYAVGFWHGLILN
jgi:hypothetical protein